ncbi:leucine-rich repeat-containing protein 24 [Drosophila takahashii]|uniref:leucine-rich repeat-containing protein 24 n=1 Tax=Drosophila takahashii TaxID=29030 RepID=UPI001CF84E79|nr:leucine-rich repeat-containing protein 24 [Drosophila takahashii]XP_017011090.2 leucine-rich repeat-containing protein 24 [Drosophila takahashii]XP_044252093.1 leucine-rich repeat-containing protein 24 [Drosophila takahashii]
MMARRLGILLLLLLPLAAGTSDWMQSCGPCHCHWNSGKKSADCKNKALTKIPLDMSNEMQVLDFAHNQIPELRREEFLLAGLPNVHKVYLRNCTIQEVHREAFKGLHILIELDMSGNRIRELHPGTFAGLEKLRNVIINNNEIEVLPNHLFVNLSYLSRIEFRNNRLRQVQLHVFAGTVALSAISLEQNRLAHLHRETFRDLQKLMHLSLQGNAWNCSCELQDFRDFAINKRLYTPPTDCQEPPQLRGKLWSEVPSENFACRPRILGSVRSFVEANHDNISLPCRIVGSPRPNVTWVYNKRPLQQYDPRVRVLTSVEPMAAESQSSVLTSELRIVGVRASDKGAYTCVADNRGGRAEAEFQLLVSGDYAGAVSSSDGMGLGGMGAIGAPTIDPQTNVFLIICLITTTLLLLLIVVVLALFWYCRRIKTYQKDTTMMSGDGLISSKLDKTHNGSMLEGSVIMEMQKSLLNEVNPVEKPPRRTDIESVDGGDDVLEIKKTLLDDTVYVANHSRDEEAHSVALSDTTTTPRSRHTYVDDAYANSLPPDLLAFPARVPPTSPSMQSSQSNIPDQVIYGIRSPPSLTSPVYTHMTPHGIYGTKTLTAPHNGFMTLQHPKSRNLALIATANSSRQHQHQLNHQQQQLQLNHQQQQQHLLQQQQQHPLATTSPFLPAPVVYSPATGVVMKQGYMTIPRKPRAPSWAPSTSGGATGGGTIQLSEFQSPTSPNPSETGTATTAELQAEPVYDNLGLRTTAGGNSTLNLNKIAGGSSNSGSQAAGQQYSMRDRPLPATPSLTSVNSANNAANASKIYEPIHELIQQQQQQLQQQQRLSSLDTEPLYGVRHQGITILPGSSISGAGLAYISPVPSAVSPSHAGDSPKLAKIPPRPPPKPKKKMSVTTTRSGQGSTSQLFDDEGEDGTEV